MLKGIKRGLAAIVLGASSFFAGCSFEQGNERVSIPVPIVFCGAGVMGINHDIYENSSKERTECSFETAVSGNILTGGQIDMRIYGKDKKFLWMYKSYGGLGGVDRTEFYNSKSNKIKEVKSVPRGLPVSIYFSNTEWISYRDIDGSFVDPRRLVDIQPEKIK